MSCSAPWKDADPDVPYPEGSQDGIREGAVSCNPGLLFPSTLKVAFRY